RGDLGIRGRVAPVAGASQGIGRAIAAELAAEGAKVAISSRSREKIDATAAEIGATGVVLDSANLEAMPGVVAEVERALGPIDILVCNTGGPPGGPDPLGFDREQWETASRTLVLAQADPVERALTAAADLGRGCVSRGCPPGGARGGVGGDGTGRAPACRGADPVPHALQ